MKKASWLLTMVLTAGYVASSFAGDQLFNEKDNPNEIVNNPMGRGLNLTRAEWEASNFATEEELQWFRNAKYGMFIHFGLSTRVNEDVSWPIVKHHKAPDIGTGKYEDHVWQGWTEELKFEKFDAEEWVTFAKKAGFKYIVLIVKHHDGFHLWDTEYSDFKITNTPFGRDYTKEVVDACHKFEMPIGIYYSQRDWYHPDYMPVDPEKVTRSGINWKLKPGFKTQQGESHPKYIDYQNRVVEELCTKYGKIDIWWWDAAYCKGMYTADMWDSEAINRKIRKWQPGIVINDRCSIPGDFSTPERQLGTYQDFRMWESCMTLTRSWAYSPSAPEPIDQLIHMIVNNTCGDGNLLLSWGPKWSGEFAEDQKERLLEVADWLKQNGSAIYGTRGGPWKLSFWGGSCRKGKKIYLHIQEFIGDTMRLPSIPDCKVVSAKLLNGQTISFDQSDKLISIIVPKEQRVVPFTIVELTMDQSVMGLAAIGADEQSMFIDKVTYGEVVSYNAKVKTSSTSKYDPAGSPQILVAKEQPRPFAFHTSEEVHPWVEIDMGKEISVKGLRIVNRQDTGQTKANSMCLKVSKDGNKWDEIWRAEGKSSKSIWEVPVTDFVTGTQVPGRKARYIRLELKNKKPTYFHLKQVLVYGKDDE